MERKTQEISEEFLKEVYVQCNNVYLAFVNFRFQLLATFISNAALFAFAHTHKDDLFLAASLPFVGIVVTWVTFFIDQRNLYIFTRATQKAERIENYFNVPAELGLHTKSERDLKKKTSHTRIFAFLTISATCFWILFLVYCIMTR